MSGNMDQLDMHTRGIRHVVALRGGPDRLGNNLENLLLSVDHSDDLQGLKGFFE